MGWTGYKGLQVPDTASGDAGINLTNDLMTLADRTSGTTGSVLFVGSSGYISEDNGHFFFDESAKTLHLIGNPPSLRFEDDLNRFLTINGPSSGNGLISVSNTGAGLDITTSGTGAISFKTNGSTRAQVAGDGTSSTLAVSGSIATALASKTANYTLTGTDSAVLANASGGAFTLTLPTAVGCAGRQYLLKKTDSSGNAVTVATTSSQTIDGASTYSLATQYAHVTLISDGSNWMVF